MGFRWPGRGGQMTAMLPSKMVSASDRPISISTGASPCDIGCAKRNSANWGCSFLYRCSMGSVLKKGAGKPPANGGIRNAGK